MYQNNKKCNYNFLIVLFILISNIFSQDAHINVSSYNGESLEIYLENSVSVAGFQMDLISSFDDFSMGEVFGGSSEDAGFLISTGDNTILGFSLTGDSIAPGEGPIVSLSLLGEEVGYAELQLDDIVISDPNDYSRLVEEWKNQDGISYEFRKELSQKVFQLMAAYNLSISNYMVYSRICKVIWNFRFSMD